MKPRRRTRSSPHSVGSPPNCLDKGLPVRMWRLQGIYAKIRGPHQDNSDRVALPQGPELQTIIEMLEAAQHAAVGATVFAGLLQEEEEDSRLEDAAGDSPEGNT